MHFSLKGTLALTAYAVLAVASVTTAQPLLGNAIWIATFGAVVYAIVLAFLARGASKGAPIGFVAACSLFLAGVLLVDDVMPTTQLVDRYFGASDAPAASRRRLAYQGVPVNVGFSLKQANNAANMERRLLSRAWLRTTHGAAHAIGVLAAGLIGAAIGAIAAQQAGQSTAHVSHRGD